MLSLIGVWCTSDNVIVVHVDLRASMCIFYIGYVMCRKRK